MAEGQSVSWALLTKVDGATLLSLRPALGGAGAMSWVSAGLVMAEGQSVSWALLTKVDGATLLSLRPALGRSRGSWGDKGAGDGRGAERKLGGPLLLWPEKMSNFHVASTCICCKVN